MCDLINGIIVETMFVYLFKNFYNIISDLFLNYNYSKMKKILLAISLILLTITAIAQNHTPGIVESNGLYFTDGTQSKFYTGEYKEFYPTGELKVEMNLKDGKPEGSYIVYFSNGKPNEVRAYRNGQFHGIWRTYNDAGLLISEAEYRNDKKTGTWHVWDDSGIMRYEMQYDNGKKTGTWYMWDEKGKLISEKKY
jgi:hypothetical protein